MSSCNLTLYFILAVIMLFTPLWPLGVFYLVLCLLAERK